MPARQAAAALPLPVYISQVQITGGKDNTAQDFVELFNPNTAAVDLKGYRLVKRGAAPGPDSLIKSWTKSTTIPPKSFYLWANVAFTAIAAKPDVATSATLADDNGVALRFGTSDTGTIIDSLAWGAAKDGFKKSKAGNPGPRQAIFRQDLYAATSVYGIAAANPRNSSVTDLQAAFNLSQTPKKSASANPANPAPKTVVVLSPADNAGTVNAETASVSAASIVSEQMSPENLATGAPAASPPDVRPARPRPIGYLILAVAALLALILIAVKYLKTSHNPDKIEKN